MTENLLVIISDEHQAAALSCLGHFVKTPNLDRLAAKGTLFRRAYTPSPICVPARASFATGHYPHKTRCWDNAMPYHGQWPSWGHALQRAGIDVESIGKLHYRSSDDDNGFDREFRPMNVVGGHGMVWASVREEDKRKQQPADMRMLGKYIGPGTSTYTDYDDAMTAETCRWLKERGASDRKAPWCLYVGLVAPHFPLVVPQEFYDLYDSMDLPAAKLSDLAATPRHPWVEKQNAFMDSDSKFKDDAERRSATVAYWALVSYLDSNIGQILDALEASGQANNTSIIYSSDHGDNVGSRRLWGKSNMYEESAAIPMIAVGQRYTAGKTCHTPVSLVDVSQTIVEHFGQKIPNSDLGAVPGASLATIGAQDDDPSRVVFSEYHAAGAVSGAFMVTNGRWKYIHYEGFGPELFDLLRDPEELNNLARDPAHAADVALMHAELLKICDPVQVNKNAFDDQHTLIQSYGGIDAAFKIGAPGATPPPKQ